MYFSPVTISSILNTSDVIHFDDDLSEISIDSRTIIRGSRTLFVALQGEKHHGINFIDRVVQKGVSNLVVPFDYIYTGTEELNFYRVSSTLEALQKLASAHREKLLAPVIGITGSNGKTIVKEWIFQLLHETIGVQRSPQSYNSQIGVALSILKIDDSSDLVLIEAGISRPEEMTRLREMIKPEIGIVTNIGDAHSAGFVSIQAKLDEKMKLFYPETKVIYRREHSLIHNSLEAHANKISWTLGSDRLETDYSFKFKNRVLSLDWHGEVYSAFLSFSDGASLENICHAIVASHHVFDDLKLIFSNLSKIQAIDWRLNVHEDSNGKVIINDSYNSDITGFQKALEVLNVHAQNRDSLVILSALEDQKVRSSDIYSELTDLLKASDVDRVWAIAIPEEYQQKFSELNVNFFSAPDEITLRHVNDLPVHSAVLIKGSRKSKLEKLSRLLQLDSSRSVLEIDMAAIGRNIGRFSKRLNSKTKIMLMLKASSYGLGVEMAHYAENQGIDMIGVAFTSEAIEMRQKGIRLPILVMHMARDEYRFIDEYRLIPLINSSEEFFQLEDFAEQNKRYISCHLNLNTGMNRLGIDEFLLSDIIEVLNYAEFLVVKGVMTHLAASGDAQKDNLTKAQISKFDLLYNRLAKGTLEEYERHVLNSDGIIRFPEAQHELVRLGIGMYGISSDENLECAVALKSRVAQLRKVQADATIGYGGRNPITEPKLIATVAMGYADGIPRKLGNGAYYVMIGGNKYPTIGDICMDFFMVDVTNTKKLIKLGEEVTIFASANSLRELSDVAETIPYEIFSSIPTRVKREYHYHNQ